MHSYNVGIRQYSNGHVSYLLYLPLGDIWKLSGPVNLCNGDKIKARKKPTI